MSQPALDYMDAGSLGTKSWVPCAVTISNAIASAREFSRRFLSDQLDGEETDEEGPVDCRDGLATGKPVCPEGIRFSIRGTDYMDYTVEVHPFVQKYGEEEVRFLAIQHRPPASCGSVGGQPVPFTLYFNIHDGRVRQTLGLPVILYSPGPPYSFHPRGTF